MPNFLIEVKETNKVVVKGILAGEIKELEFIVARYNKNLIGRRMSMREIETSHPLNDAVNRVAAI